MFGFKTKGDKDKIRIAEKMIDDHFHRRKVMEIMNNEVNRIIDKNAKLTPLRCITQTDKVIDGTRILYFGPALFFKLIENIENGNIDVTKLK